MLISGAGKVSIPQLPPYKDLEKYIQRIDESRHYSNFGCLNIELAKMLSTHFGDEVSCLPVNSGTSALIAGILSIAGRAKEKHKVCILPSYTFIGTVAAVVACGYHPYLMDVDANSLDISCESILSLPFLDSVGLIVPVAVYGKNPDISKWEEVSIRHSIPVVIDAAACFDIISHDNLIRLKNCILTLSFHPTKVFSTGEGGGIVFSKKHSCEKFIRAVNFGFYNSRVSFGDSINGKLSEYHAAIGLASLDTWKEKIKIFERVRESYHSCAAKYNLQQLFSNNKYFSHSYCIIDLNSEFSATKVQNKLGKCGIDSRRWYEGGLHTHPSCSEVPRAPLPVTTKLSESFLGLPMHVHLLEKDIEIILSSLANILSDKS